MLTGLREAFGWMTVLPVRPTGRADPVPWFSWAGAALGAAGAATALSVSHLAPDSLGALLAGVCVVSVWAALTGMLHLDGLADAADALAACSDRQRRLEIMRDSRIGSYGAAALVLVLALGASAAAVAVSHAKWWTIVWAPAVARLGSSIALATLPPARAEGLAFRLAGRRSSGAFVVAALPIIAMLPFVIREGVVAIVGGLAAALFVPRALSRWLGGITGDLVGAGIVLVEVTTLLACALAAR